MSKMITWLGMMSGVTLLFYFTGLLQNTPNSALLTLALNPTNFKTTPLWLSVFGVLGLLAMVGQVVSVFLSRSVNSDFWILGPIATIFFGFGWDFLSIYQTINATSAIGGVIAVLIFGPLLIMYFVSVLEWWRGVNP